VRLEVRLLDQGLALPRYAHEGDAGLDLLAVENVTLQPGDRAAVPTGIAIGIPEGYAGFVLPRSGRALKEGLGVANAPGLIDSGYRGEVKVILVNLDPHSAIDVKRGDKIAQLVVQRVEQAEVTAVDILSDTERGPGGLGSTGR
jgi:dUTP pyrophosphatase